MTAEQCDLAISNMGLASHIVTRRGFTASAFHSPDEAYGMAYLSLCKAAITYNESRGNFGRYLSTIIHNDRSKDIRHNNAHSPCSKSIGVDFSRISGGSYEQTSDIDDHMVAESLMRIADRVLRTESPRNQLIYRMYLAGSIQQEIGKAVHCRRENVSFVVKRINERIRRIYFAKEAQK